MRRAWKAVDGTSDFLGIQSSGTAAYQPGPCQRQAGSTLLALHAGHSRDRARPWRHASVVAWRARRATDGRWRSTAQPLQARQRKTISPKKERHRSYLLAGEHQRAARRMALIDQLRQPNAKELDVSRAALCRRTGPGRSHRGRRCTACPMTPAQRRMRHSLQ